jgi:hypothetical protein
MKLPFVIALVCSLLFVDPFGILAEKNVIYYSNEDFRANKGETFDSISGYFWTIGGNGNKISFSINGEKQNVKTSKIWGFYYKNVFFRIDDKDVPAALINEGKIAYFEHGWGHISMLKNATTSAQVGNGSFCYLAINRESPLMALSAKKPARKVKAFKNLVMLYPNFKPLIDCLPGAMNYNRVRDCVSKFEGEK